MIDARLDRAKFGLAVRSISVSTAPGLKLAYASSISDSTPDPRRNFRPDTDPTRRSSSEVFPIPASSHRTSDRLLLPGPPRLSRV